MLVGQPQLGFSITDPFKKIGTAVYKAHVEGTKLLVQAAKDPRVQRAAAQSAQAYAQAKYAPQYAKGMEYYQQGRQILRPPPGAMMPQQPEQAFDEEGEPMPASSPVQHGNIMLIGGAVVLGLLVLFAMRK